MKIFNKELDNKIVFVCGALFFALALWLIPQFKELTYHDPTVEERLEAEFVDWAERYIVDKVKKPRLVGCIPINNVGAWIDPEVVSLVIEYEGYSSLLHLAAADRKERAEALKRQEKAYEDAVSKAALNGDSLEERYVQLEKDKYEILKRMQGPTVGYDLSTELGSLCFSINNRINALSKGDGYVVYFRFHQKQDPKGVDHFVKLVTPADALSYTFCCDMTDEAIQQELAEAERIRAEQQQ